MSTFAAIPGIGDLFGGARLGASAYRVADAGFDMGRQQASNRIGEVGTFSKIVGGRIKSSEMNSIASVLRQQHGTTIHYNSSLAKKLGNHFDSDLNQIHLAGGASKQRRGLFYEEVQHAFDFHAGAYTPGMSNMRLHSITARNLIDNPLLPTTALENASLLKLANDWGR